MSDWGHLLRISVYRGVNSLSLQLSCCVSWVAPEEKALMHKGRELHPGGEHWQLYPAAYRNWDWNQRWAWDDVGDQKHLLQVNIFISIFLMKKLKFNEVRSTSWALHGTQVIEIRFQRAHVWRQRSFTFHHTVCLLGERGHLSQWIIYTWHGCLLGPVDGSRGS